MLNLEPIASRLEAGQSTIDNCDELGFVSFVGFRFLTFAESDAFLLTAAQNPWVQAVLFPAHRPVPELPRQVTVLACDDPTTGFFELHNTLETPSVQPSQIAPTANLHPTAVVAPMGVRIGADTRVEALVSIEPNTIIGERCIIRAGARLGGESLDFKERPDGSPLVTAHHGFLRIEDDVEVGYNSVIDRATFRHQATVIGAGTRVAALCTISHGVILGPRNRLAAGVQISGGTQAGEHNWFGPGSVTTHMTTIGSENFIAIASSVLRPLEDDWQVVGPQSRVFRDRHIR